MSFLRHLRRLALVIGNALFRRLISVTRKDASNNTLTSTSYGYDPHGRQSTITDARNGATTLLYNAADLVVTNLAPAPAAGQSAPVTVYFYDTSLRQTGQRLPDGAVVTNVFLANGLIQKTWGSRLYPVEYTFDYAGRMKTMTTWQQFNQATGSGLSGSAVTTWNYDTARGWLTNKTYAEGLGPVYTNTPAGRLGKRTWARSVSTVYSYNAAGDLTGADYSDATPDIAYGYDRLGRQTAATNGTVAMTRLFSDVGLLLAENHATGPLAGLAVSNRYDQYLRRTNLSILNLPSSILFSQSYGFDSAGRLATVSSGTNTAAYGYLANSPLVEHIWFTNGSTLRMTTTKQYDLLNRLTEISSVSSASSVVRSAYAYNSVNQRTALTNADNSYWVYTYDSLGQVTSGRKYWANGTPVAGQQFDYTFDSIGNRQTAASGGNQFGTGLRQQNYSANNLNQYTSRTVPPYVDVLGTAASNATVTVWGDKALPILSTDPAGLVRVLRQGEYWRAEVPLNNSTGALWLTLTNYAVLNQGTNADVLSSTTGSVLVTKSPEAFTYDLDGNLTSDSLWTNAWNGENRRVTVESGTGILPVARMREQWTFLPDGRWIERIVSTNNGGAYSAAYTNRYVWDGNVLLAVLDRTNGVTQSFTRGLDLNGTPQGAGGAGGLLWVWDRSSVSNQPSTHCAAFDGNGNVMALVNLSDGTTSAEYAYGPFAEPLQATGPMAKANPLRFSTQYADDVTGDVHYLFRTYTSRTGRWLSRDPIEERGGRNLYAFVYNDPANKIDPLGQNAADLALKIAGRQIPKAFGLNAGGIIVAKVPWLRGLIAGGATSVMFFPDSCEVAGFSVRAGLGNTLADWRAAIADDFGKWREAGLLASIGVGIEAAGYVGNTTPGSANAASFVGLFHTFQVGFTAEGVPIGASVYLGDKDATGGRWIGGTLGVGPGVGLAVIDWNYQTMIGPVTVKPKCLCYAAILAMP